MPRNLLTILVAFVAALWMQVLCPCCIGKLGDHAPTGQPTAEACCCEEGTDCASEHQDAPAQPGLPPTRGGSCCCGSEVVKIPAPAAHPAPMPLLVVVAVLDVPVEIAADAAWFERPVACWRAPDRASSTLYGRHCALIV